MKTITTIILTIFTLISTYSQDSKINVKCVDATSNIEIKDAADNILKTFTGNGSYDYTATPGTKIKIKMILQPSGEYIQKPYELKSGTENNICMSLANVDGFYDTDREQLDSLASYIVKKIERREGVLQELEAWSVKAVLDLQANPNK